MTPSPIPIDVDLGVRGFVRERARVLTFVIGGFVLGFATGPEFWWGLLYELLAGLVDALPLLAGVMA